LPVTQPLGEHKPQVVADRQPTTRLPIG
jgi:hypothetical protein